MKDQNAEEKILTVADIMFTRDGFAATSLRDMANMAEVNPALINYYYKSKENLFAIVMKRKAKQLFGSILPCMTDEASTLEEKTAEVAKILSRVVAADRDLPMFVFSELQKQDTGIAEVLPAQEIMQSSFVKQLAAKQPDVNPFHYILNLFSLTVAPYIMLPMWTKTGLISQQETQQLLEERTGLIPQWLKRSIE